MMPLPFNIQGPARSGFLSFPGAWLATGCLFCWVWEGPRPLTWRTCFGPELPPQIPAEEAAQASLGVPCASSCLEILAENSSHNLRCSVIPSDTWLEQTGLMEGPLPMAVCWN